MLQIAAVYLKDYAGRVPSVALVIALLIAVRRYAAGFVYRPRSSRRTLAGKTFIIADAFSTGAATCLVQEMANLGAQLVLLHPDPSDARVLQLVMLVRSTSENERIYAEACDLDSLRSIEAFADGWKKRARAGAVGDLEARMDGIIFASPPLISPFGSARRTVDPVLRESTSGANEKASPKVEKNDWAYVGSRLALLNVLEDIISKSARTSPVKIVSLVSPFYAASLPDPDDLEWIKRPYPSRSPWLVEGQASLSWLSVSRRLQERFDDKNREGGTTGAGIAFLNVCEGFSRSATMAFLTQSTVIPKPLRLLAAVTLWPMAYMLLKGSRECTQTTLACLLEPVMRKDDATAFYARQRNAAAKKRKEKGDDDDNDDRVLDLRGGVLYREGRPTRVMLLESAPAGFEKNLFDRQERRLKLMRSETKVTDSKLKEQLEERLQKAKQREGVQQTKDTEE